MTINISADDLRSIYNQVKEQGGEDWTAEAAQYLFSDIEFTVEPVENGVKITHIEGCELKTAVVRWGS